MIWLIVDWFPYFFGKNDAKLFRELGQSEFSVKGVFGAETLLSRYENDLLELRFSRKKLEITDFKVGSKSRFILDFRRN